MGAAPVAKRRNAQLHSRWSNRPRTFNGDCREVCLSPHLRFGARAMRCRGVARAFDEPLLHFSEKQRIRRAVAATGPVQTRPKQRKNALSAMWISVPFSQTKVRSASAVALSTDRSWPVCDCVSCVCVRVRQSVFAVLSASRVASRVGGAVRSRAVRSRSG
jgi:hypothetical protein